MGYRLFWLGIPPYTFTQRYYNNLLATAQALAFRNFAGNYFNWMERTQ